VTRIAKPSSNPELLIVFGGGSSFGSESRLQPHLFNHTEDLDTDETPMEHGLGTGNCFFRPSFYPSPANYQFDVPIRGFRRFLICVYSVFHPWPKLPCPSFIRSNTAGYVRLFDPFWRKDYLHLVKNQQPSRHMCGGARLPARLPEFQCYFARN